MSGADPATGKGYVLRGVVQAVTEWKAIGKGQKCDLVIEVGAGEKYPQLVSFDVWDRNKEILAGVGEGDFIEVTFDVRGRASASTGKVWNSLTAWQVKDLTARTEADATAGDALDAADLAAEGGDDAPPF